MAKDMRPHSTSRVFLFRSYFLIGRPFKQRGRGANQFANPTFQTAELISAFVSFHPLVFATVCMPKTCAFDHGESVPSLPLVHDEGWPSILPALGKIASGNSHSQFEPKREKCVRQEICTCTNSTAD